MSDPNFSGPIQRHTDEILCAIIFQDGVVDVVLENLGGFDDLLTFKVGCLTTPAVHSF